MDEVISTTLPHHSSQGDLGEQRSLQDEKIKKSQTLPLKNRPALPPRPPSKSLSYSSGLRPMSAQNAVFKTRDKPRSLSNQLINSNGTQVKQNSSTSTFNSSEEPSTTEKIPTEDKKEVSSCDKHQAHVSNDKSDQTDLTSSEQSAVDTVNVVDDIPVSPQRVVPPIPARPPPSVINELHLPNTVVHIPSSTQEASTHNSIQSSKVNRPSMPQRPPPPLTRPPRPFPPPSNEAMLVKKRPPPTPPLIIDSRNSPQHIPHSQRTLKVTNITSPSKISTNKTNSSGQLPPRPPPPSLAMQDTDVPESPMYIHHNEDITRTDVSDSSKSLKTEQIQSNVINPTIPITDQNNGKSDVHVHINSRHTMNEDSVPEEEIRVSSTPLIETWEGASPQPDLERSPLGRKKFVGKMKESFRSFTKRRNRTVHGNNRVDSNAQSSQIWRRGFSSRSCNSLTNTAPVIPEYDQDRYPDKLPTGVVDPLLLQCVSYLNKEEVLKEPGLFRIPGDITIIKRLRSQFIVGEEVDLSEIRDPNIITGLLKVHFREKPTSLISSRQTLNQIVTAVKTKNVDAFKELLLNLDEISLASLRMLSELFKRITEYSEENHMTSGILATSCGPSFFPNLPPSNANALVKFLTDNCDDLFSTEYY